MAVSIHGNNGVTTTNGTAAAPSLAAPDNDTGLYFGTNLIHASTDGTERLRIHADGEVEIKEAAAGQTVLSCTAAYASSSTVDIQTWARSDGAVKASMKYSHGTNTMNFGTTTNHALIFQVNNTEKLKIATDGVITSSATHPQVILKDPAGRQVSLRAPSTSNLAALGTDSNHALVFYTNGYSNDRLRITSAGLISIGDNNNLDSQLTVTQAQGDCIRLRTSASNNT